MGIVEDYYSLKKIWSDFTPLTKIFLLGTFLVTALSIASLAEDVAKFRGFIVTAIRFYRMLTYPLIRALSLPQVTIDALVLITVILVAQTRATIVAKDHLWKPSPGDLRMTIFVILTEILASFFIGSADKEIRMAVILFVGCAAILLFDIIRGYGRSGKTRLMRVLLYVIGIEEDETKRLQSRLQISYIFAAILLVAVIAAISEGLTGIS